MTVTDAGRRWVPRPVLSRVVRGLVLLVPVAAGVAAAVATVQLAPDPLDRPHALAIWMLAVVLSTVAVLAVERMTRRMLPLATLMRLSLLFPGAAPSRFRTALKAGSTRRLHRLVEEDGGTAAEAAGRILAYAMAISRHDRRTRGHSERVRAYAEVLAEELGVDGEDRDKLRWAALLHDVGKLDVDPEILNKQGRPDESEWERLRRHPVSGAEIAAPLLPWLGDWGDTIEQHHERVDGRGYPLGLVGDDISLGARIVAVADAFETMTSPRSYKPAVSAEEAREEILRCAGTQFDPAVVRALANTSVARLERIAAPLAWVASLPTLPSVSAPTASATSTAAAAGAVALTMLVPIPPSTGPGGSGPSEVLDGVEQRPATATEPDAGGRGADARNGTDPSGPGSDGVAPAGSAPPESATAGPGQPAPEPGDGGAGGSDDADGARSTGGSDFDGGAPDGTQTEEAPAEGPIEEAVPDEVESSLPGGAGDVVGDADDAAEDVQETVEDIVDPSTGAGTGGGPPASDPPPVADPPGDAPPVVDPPTDAPPLGAGSARRGR